MLSEGNFAPDFRANSDTQQEIQLSQYCGKIVVLFFYPAAFTPGCTAQACGFRDIYEDLLEMNAVVIGVSIDVEKTQQAFKSKHNFQFPLITDTTKEISNLYGGIGRFAKKANRITFLIDSEGKIRKIWKLTGILAQLNLGSHANEVKNEILELTNPLTAT